MNSPKEPDGVQSPAEAVSLQEIQQRAAAAADVCRRELAEGRAVSKEWIREIERFEEERASQAAALGLADAASVAEVLEAAERRRGQLAPAALLAQMPADRLELTALRDRAAAALQDPASGDLDLLARVAALARSAQEGTVDPQELAEVLAAAPDLAGAMAFVAAGTLVLPGDDEDEATQGGRGMVVEEEPPRSMDSTASDSDQKEVPPVGEAPVREVEEGHGEPEADDVARRSGGGPPQHPPHVGADPGADASPRTQRPGAVHAPATTDDDHVQATVVARDGSADARGATETVGRPETGRKGPVEPEGDEDPGEISPREQAAASEETAGEPAEEAAPSALQERAVLAEEDQRTGHQEDAEALLPRLILEHRDGLALFIARAAGQSEARLSALHALALCRTVDTGTEPAAVECGHALEELATTGTEFDHASRFLAVAAAIPVAAAAPHLGGAQVLAQHRVALTDTARIEAFVARLQETAEKGISLRHDIASAAHTLVSLDSQQSAISSEAQELLTHPTRVKYQRASQVMRDLTHPEGELGQILHAVKDADDGSVDMVTGKVERLRQRGAIDDLIDASTARLRATQRKKIDGDARARLAAAIQEILDLAARWTQLRHTAQRPARDDAWLEGQVEALRAASRNLETDDRGPPRGNDEEPLVAAARSRVIDAIDYVLRLLDGRVDEVDDRPAPLILAGELLRDADIRLDSNLAVLAEPSLDQLVNLGSEPDWSGAALARAECGDEPLVEWTLHLVSEDARPALEAEVDRLLTAARKTARLLEDTVESDLASKFQRGALDPESWQQSSRALDGIQHEDSLMVGQRTDRLRALQRDIEDTAHTHVELKRLELEAQLTEADVDGRAADLVRQALADQDVATAERVVLEAERGQPLPAPTTVDVLFERVFPAVPELLVDTRTDGPALAERLRAEGTLFELPGGDPSDEAGARAADALNHMPLTGSTTRKDGPNAVRSVLEVLGLSTESVGSGPTQANWRGYTARARVSDKALVPHFGSQARGGYRVVIIPPADASEGGISSWLLENPTDQATIALYHGVLPMLLRRRLADRGRRAPAGSQALIADLAVVGAAAAIAPGSFECFARLALPFTGINPYNPYASGVVPEEMFYGRGEAVEDLLAADGQVAFVYGGRRLGKSALLRDAERRAGARSDIVARYIDLKDKGVGDYQPTDYALELIEQELDEVLPPTRKQLPDARLNDRVMQHAQTVGSPRLLVLLDEADPMIDADASNDFRILNTLRRLREDTGKRIRFVFAGLHSVRRFHDVANQRLVHFGTSLTIGALFPLDARKLIERPLEALGYRLPDDAINRILTVTQHQPSLIQLVCDELLKYLSTRSVDPSAPPHAVTREDVERVLGLPTLTREIADRFELTIRLDERYRFIALLVAYLAAEDHMNAMFEIGELRLQCESRWPAGFADTTRTEFESLLDEMVGLSVLYEREGHYGLHSPHVGRMLGTQQQIESKLVDAAKQPAPKRSFDGTAFRQPLPSKGRAAKGYRLSPLDLLHVKDLQARNDGLRIVIGTAAHRSSDVRDAMETLVGEPDDIEMLIAEGTLVDPEQARWFVGRLKAGSRAKHRVTFGVAGDIDAGALRSLLAGASEALSKRTRDRTSSLGVLLVDQRALGPWVTLLSEGIEEHVALKSLGLRRHNLDSLRVWSSREVDLPWFETDEAATRVVELTGGWPVLVDRTVEVLRRERDLDKALKDIRTHLDEGGGHSLVEDVGIHSDERLRRSFELLAELHRGLPAPEAPDLLAEMCDLPGPEAHAAWRVLRAVGAVDVDEVAGTVRPEPVLAHYAVGITPNE